MNKQERNLTFARNVQRYNFVYVATMGVVEDYGMADKLSSVDFTDSTTCYHKYEYDVSPMIKDSVLEYGFPAIDCYWEKGYTEYKSLQLLYNSLVNNSDLYFMRKSHTTSLSLVLHEVSHFIEGNLYGVYKGVSHGRSYQRVYKKVFEKYFNQHWLDIFIQQSEILQGVKK